MLTTQLTINMEEIGVPIFVHPSGAANVVQENGLRGRLENIIGNPLETTVFLSHMIFDGTLDRFPGLKICGAHGGGYLPSYFERTGYCQRKAEVLPRGVVRDGRIRSASGRPLAE